MEPSRLIAWLQATEEVRRAELAAQSHDRVGALIAAARIEAQRTEPRSARISQLLAEAAEANRQVVEALRPSSLDHLGLVPALRQLVDESCQQRGLSCSQSYPDVQLDTLPPDAAIAIYRIAATLLLSVANRARPRNIALVVDADGDEFTLTVSGEAAAQSPATGPAALAMAAAEHRVAALGGRLIRRTTAAGCGTRITLAVPWHRLQTARPSARAGAGVGAA
jgi:glucose-6-phosphate-specific signal transduction histidine kinase